MHRSGANGRGTVWPENMPLPTPNYLEMIFAGQHHLIAKYHAIEEANGANVVKVDEYGDLNNRYVQMRLHDLFGYLVRELSEAMQEVKGKPWKRDPLPESDRAKFVEEMGDAFHFFVEMCITAGMTADELHRAYFRMHEKNNSRIASGTY